MNACERFVCVSLQCLNKTLLYRDNLPTNYTCPPFSGPVSAVLHFQVLHFHALTFGPSFTGHAFSCLSSFLVPHFQVLHFQSTRGLQTNDEVENATLKVRFM